jgi:Tol biopolymer transport system component
MSSGRWWFLAGCLVLGFVACGVAHAGVFQCASPDSTEGTEAVVADSTRFVPYRFRDFPYSTLRHRDLELLWDSAYDAELPEAVMVTLDLYAGTLVDRYAGNNVLGYDMSRIELLYNYCRRVSEWPRAYSRDARDTTSVVFGDSSAVNIWMFSLKDCAGRASEDDPCSKPSDRSHVDVYLSGSTRAIWGIPSAKGGCYSPWVSPNEDSSTFRSRHSIKHANSLAMKLPGWSARIDTAGTGWASPSSYQSEGFAHEFAHGLPGGPVNGGSLDEQFAAVGEALVGAYDETDASDMAYTWSLLGHNTQPAGTLRGYGKNYVARSGFAAYLVYNFPGADTSKTLTGMEDDLARQWISLLDPLPGLGALRDLLRDSTCADCAWLLDPPGVPQSDTSRLALLHHYWRAATYVNNPSLDHGQYGYPSRYGFAPGAQLNAWQNANGIAADDAVAIPPEITMGPAHLTRDTTLYGSRSLNGSSYPLVLQIFGSEYWIVRSDPALAASSQDLVIRVWSDSLGRYEGISSEPIGGDEWVVVERTWDGWVTASVVGYSEQSGPGGQPEELWRHPDWATTVFAPKRMATDSLRGGLEFVVPGFGTNVKAVLVPITLADGPHQGFERKALGTAGPNSTPFPYGEVAPYTLHLALRAAPDSAPNPALVAGSRYDAEEAPSFAPDGRHVAHELGDRVYVTDVGGPNSCVLVYSDLEQHRPDWSPRGDMIAFESYLPPSWQYEWQAVMLYDLETEELAPLRITGQGDDFFPCFSPNGQQVAYAVSVGGVSERPWQLRRIDVSGENDTVLVQSGAERPPTSLRWSSDGRWIYFITGDSLYSASTDSLGVVVSRAELASRVTSFDMRPSDGRLVMEEPGAVTYRVEVGDEEGSWLETRLQPFRRIAVRDTTRRLSIPWFYRTGAQYYGPRWSPDGTRIAYSTDENQVGNVDLYVGRVSYNHAPQFVNAPRDTVLAGACDATLVQSWSASDPDGEAITFSAVYLPAGAIVSAQGQLTWPDPGPAGSEHFVVVRALDGSGGIAQKVIRIAVEPDSMRPAAVADLTPTMGRTTAIVEWTAPGDDSLTGTACRTRIAYSAQQITEGSFLSCDTIATSEPGSAGSAQCAEVSGLTCNRRYYFALKTQDDAGQWSALSNVVTALTSCSGYQEVLCGGDLMAQGEGESGWSLENSILDLAVDDASLTDIYALESARATTKSSAKVRLSNRRTDGYLLKDARLEVVDHAAGVLAVAGRGRVLVGTASPPARLTTPDGDTLAATADAAEYAHVAAVGDVWEVLLTEDGTAGKGVLIEAGGGKPRGPAAPGGIEVQVPWFGEWRTLTWLYPRRLFGRLVADSIETDRVRLCFHDEYRVKSVERFVPAGGVSPTTLAPTTVSWLSSAKAADADAPTVVSNTQLGAGEALMLEFALGTAARDRQRDVFLVVTGQRISSASLADATEQSLSARGVAASSLPTVFRLYPAEPNPFSAGTRVRFDLPRAARVSLEVFDLQGRRVARLADEPLLAGAHVREWAGLSERGGRTQPGVYLCRFVAGGFRAQEKLVLLP